MNKGDGTKLVNVMQRIAEPTSEEEAGVIIGTVKTLSPLCIQIDEKLLLTEEFLILGAMVKRTVVAIPAVNETTYREDDTHRHSVDALTTSTDGEHPHSHTVPAHYTSYELPEICLWRGLEVGDVVYLLRMNRGQKYFVLQREEGIT